MIRNKVFIHKAVLTSNVASVALVGDGGDAGGCQYVPGLRLAILLPYPWLTGSAGHFPVCQWDPVLQLFRTCDCPIAGQLRTNAIKASIRSGRRVIDSENDEFRDPVLIEIEHRNISALVFP